MFVSLNTLPFAIHRKDAKEISIVIFKGIDNGLVLLYSTDTNFGQITIYLNFGNFLENYEYSANCVNWISCRGTLK